jgi:sodium-dependent dicarboxylate transporter 2/3/5
MLLKRTGLVAGSVTPLLILMHVDFAGNQQAVNMAAIAVMMSVFWITEAIPLAATALLPLVFFPMLGIASSKVTAGQYMNSTVFLLIGGFMIALAMQRWNLHKRIALNILSFTGGHPVALAFGFMFATSSLSMWISNTATTLVMLPIAMAIISRFQQTLSTQQAHKLSVGLLLSIAYSASIGGMMTLVGTAPNLVFSRSYQVVSGEAVGFLQWMIIAVPLGVMMILLLLGVIFWFYLREIPSSNEIKNVLNDEKRQLGEVSYAEKMVLAIFLLTAGLWISRKGLTLGDFKFQGWAEFLPFGTMLDDGSVAIAMATLMFFIPAAKANGDKGRILDEKVFAELPWAVVILFGGGFALAFGFIESGLSVYLADQLQGLKNMSLPVIIFSVTAGMSLLTELTSNTATAQLVMPILIATAQVIDIPAVWLMLPAVLAASCAFMFPVATPPNAIVFGSGKIKVAEMLRVGFVLNCAAVLLISILSYLLVPVIMTGMGMK